MSFEIAQELSSTFKGNSTILLACVSANVVVDVDKKIDSLTALKSYLKRNDIEVPPCLTFIKRLI